MARDGGFCNSSGKHIVTDNMEGNISKTASKKRSHILYNNIEHCIDIEPNQMETLLKLFEQYVGVNDEKLLTIELQDESSVPKVFYKGKEIKYKRNVYFDWETDTDEYGGLSYAIEHAELGNKFPVINRIERQVKGHAT